MPRMPYASFEDYEEPVAGCDYGSRSPQRSTHRLHATATPPTAAAVTESRLLTPLAHQRPEALMPTAAKAEKQQRTIHFAETSLSSLKLGRVQRAEEYPRLAFKPRRELRNGGQDDHTQPHSVRGTSPRRGPDFVFGRGSHGLCDQSDRRASDGDGVIDHAKSGTAASPSAVPSLSGTARKSTKGGKEASKHGGLDSTSAGTRLPPLTPSQVSTSSGQSSTAHSRRSPQTLSTAAAAPALASTPRTLRYGGVIDTFSYFAVHRTHPEMYSR